MKFIPTIQLLPAVSSPPIQLESSSQQLLTQFDRWRQMMWGLVNRCVASFPLNLQPGPPLLRETTKLLDTAKVWERQRVTDLADNADRSWIHDAIATDPEKFSNAVCLDWLTQRGVISDALEFVALKLAAEHHLFETVTSSNELYPIRANAVKTWMNWVADPKSRPYLRMLSADLQKIDGRIPAKTRRRGELPYIGDQTSKETYDLSTKAPVVLSCAYLSVLRTLKLRYNWVSGGF